MNEQFDKKPDSVYSKRLKAGKRRTYFFDVRATRGNDYFLTITESRKRPNDEGYDRHKIFLYKEDFHKFLKGLNEAVGFVKTELMPDFNFDAFNHDQDDEDGTAAPKPLVAADSSSTNEAEHQPATGPDALVASPYMANEPHRYPSGEADNRNLADKKTITIPGVSEDVDKW